MAAAKCLRLSFGAPSSRTAATPTVQVERLQPSQIIVEGPSRRIIPGGPGRYQWFTLMHSVLRNSRASCVAMSSEQPHACSRYDHPDEELSSLLPKRLKASEHRHRVAAIAASAPDTRRPMRLRSPKADISNLATTTKIRRSYALCKLTEHAMSFGCHAFDFGVTPYSAISDRAYTNAGRRRVPPDKAPRSHGIPRRSRVRIHPARATCVAPERSPQDCARSHDRLALVRYDLFRMIGSRRELLLQLRIPVTVHTAGTAFISAAASKI